MRTYNQWCSVDPRQSAGGAAWSCLSRCGAPLLAKSYISEGAQPEQTQTEVGGQGEGEGALVGERNAVTSPGDGSLPQSTIKVERAREEGGWPEGDLTPRNAPRLRLPATAEGATPSSIHRPARGGAPE